MSKSYTTFKQEMDEACEFLRGFTLGKRGMTQRDGVSGIERVLDLCARIEERFGSGIHQKEAAGAAQSARNQVLAAKARLNLLRG